MAYRAYTYFLLSSLDPPSVSLHSAGGDLKSWNPGGLRDYVKNGPSTLNPKP